MKEKCEQQEARHEIYLDGSVKEGTSPLAVGISAGIFRDRDRDEATRISWSPSKTEVPMEAGAVEIIALFLTTRSIQYAGRYGIWTDCATVTKGWGGIIGKRLTDLEGTTVFGGTRRKR